MAKPPNPFRNSDVVHLSTGTRDFSRPRVVYDEVNRPPRSAISFANDPGKTDQSQARETDVNWIMERFAKTGVLPQAKPGIFADVSSGMDFRDALHIVMHAEEQFMSLDAQTRRRFDNEPAQFLDFVSDPKNAEEMVKMGLADIRPPSDTDRLVEALTKSQTPSSQPSSSSKGRAGLKPGTEPGDDT